MKTRLSIILSPVIATFLVLVTALAVLAATTTTVVTIHSADWVFIDDNGVGGGITGFENGPATAPLGLGSAYIKLNTATAGYVFGTQKYAGTLLSAITTLTYSTYTNLSPAALAFQINYDPDATTVESTTWYGRLIYEPYQNGTVTNGIWQTWDMINGGAGKWWASPNANSTVDNDCPQAAPCTWSALIAAYPNIGIRNDALAFIQVKAGSNWNGFVGNVDALTIGIGSNTDIYDFEPETPCTTTCYVNSSTGDDTFGGDTPASAKKTIQAAVTQVSSGGQVIVAAGTYSENIVINTNGITLIGALALNPNDAPNPVIHTIISSSAPAVATSPGISLNSGVTGVTIKNLRVQNFSSNSGIYGTLGNNNLTIDSVQVYSNNTTSAVNGGGIYMNGPVSNVLINNVDSQFNKSRGIVIWNGFKQYITMTNNYVANNNCCGIELQDGTASGVIISGNIVMSNTDSGLAAIGLTSGAGPNVISNNTLTDNGRFGIEIKMPNGTGTTSGDGSIVIENNTVSLPTPGSDLRDFAGIAVMRRAYLAGQGYADIPTGVIVRNNTVSGYQQTSTSDGFGIVVEGTKMKVEGNTLTNNDVGVQVQAGHLPYSANAAGDGDQSNVADTYFGRGNSPVACAYVPVGSNTYTGNTVDYRTVGAIGIAGVTNANTGAYFCTIQQANDDPTTLNGHTLNVASGIYTEDLQITKSLTLLGPNAGINPNTGSRVAEAILHPASSGTDPYGTCIVAVYLAASNTTLDGFTIDGDNPSITSGVLVNGVDVDACEGVAGWNGMQNIVFENNIVKNTTYTGVDFDNYYNTAATAGNYIRYNRLTNIGNSTIGFGIGVLLYDNFYADLTDNVFDAVRIGVQTGNYSKANPGATGSISNNEIHSWRAGIFHNLWYSSASNVPISNNAISVISNTGTTRWTGILFTSFSVPISITANAITATAVSQETVGYMVWNDLAVPDLAISGGTVSGADYGAWVNNYQGYGPSNAGNTSITLDGVSISDAAKAGLYVQDDALNTNNATVQATLKNSTISDSAVGVQVDGADATATVKGNTLVTNTTVFSQSDGVLTAYANNITNFTTGLINTGGTYNIRHNWWGASGDPAPTGVDAVSWQARLGAPVNTWADGNPSTSLGNADLSGGTGTAVIVSHGRGSANAPFGNGIAPFVNNMCSDYYDFFTEGGGGTWTATIPVDDNPSCNSQTRDPGKAFSIPYTTTYSIECTSSNKDCWDLITTNVITSGQNIVVSGLTPADLGGTQFVAGSTTGTDPTAITLQDFSAESNSSPLLAILLAMLVLALSAVVLVTRARRHA